MAPLTKEMSARQKKLGILGGGQLGRMLIMETLKLDVNTAVLDPDPYAPCKEIANTFYVGDLKDEEMVYNFGKYQDVITIEIEHVNVQALKRLEEEGKTVYPQPRVIEIVQDKGLQKEFYQKHQIPTASFFLVNDLAEIKGMKPAFPFVQKMRTGGYDGKGVAVLQKESDWEKAFDVPSVIEHAVNIEKELSVIVARDDKGNTVAYPAVELVYNHEANLVDYLCSPADIDQETENKARALAMDVISKLEMVGVLAVELFLDKEGNLLVNEIAPRPHNSGHQTIENNFTSQYQQLMRVVLGLPLGHTDMICPAVMVNLLGEKDCMGNAVYDGLDKAMALPGVHVHLYGKKMTKPYRKMGHVTIVAKELEEAKKVADQVKKTLKVIV